MALRGCFDALEINCGHSILGQNEQREPMGEWQGGGQTQDQKTNVHCHAHPLSSSPTLPLCLCPGLLRITGGFNRLRVPGGRSGTLPTTTAGSAVPCTLDCAKEFSTAGSCI